MILVDTSVIVAWLDRNHPRHRVCLAALEDWPQRDRLAVSCVTVGELAAGGSGIKQSARVVVWRAQNGADGTCTRAEITLAESSRWRLAGRLPGGKQTEEVGPVDGGGGIANTEPGVDMGDVFVDGGIANLETIGDFLLHQSLAQ